MHNINIVFSVIQARATETSQCSWYVSSVLIDTTLGVLANYLLLSLLTSLLSKFAKAG